MVGRKGNNFKQQIIQEWTLNLSWSDKKVKARNLLGCFEINSMFRTFYPTCQSLQHGSSYRG